MILSLTFIDTSAKPFDAAFSTFVEAGQPPYCCLLHPNQVETVLVTTTSAATADVPVDVGINQTASEGQQLIEGNQSQRVMLEYTNPNMGISIGYPENWDVDNLIREGERSVSFFVYQGPDDQYGQYVDVYLIMSGEPAYFQSRDMSVDEIAQQLLTFLQDTLFDFQHISTESGEVAGMPAYTIHYTYRDPEIGETEAMEVIFKGGIYGDRLYDFAYTAKPALFNTELDTFRKMIDSVQILQPSSSPSPSTSSTIFSDTSAGKFSPAFSTFVEAGSVTGYREYQQKNGNNGNPIFNPGEDIELYLEPVGFSYDYINDTLNGESYRLDFSADVVISNATGQLLFSIEDVTMPAGLDPALISEVFINLTLSQATPFLEGDYDITYVMTDNYSGQRFRIDKTFTIAEAVGIEQRSPIVIDGILTPGEWDHITNDTHLVSLYDVLPYNITVAVAPTSDNINILTVLEAEDASSVITAENTSTVLAHLISPMANNVEDIAMIEIKPTSELSLTDGFWDVNDPLKYQKDTDFPGGTQDVIAASSLQATGKQIIEMSHPLCSRDNFDLCLQKNLSAGMPLYYSMSVGVVTANNTDATSFSTPFDNITLLRAQFHFSPIVTGNINLAVGELPLGDVDGPAPFIIGILGKFDATVRDTLLSNMTAAEREKILTGPAESDVSWFLNSLDAAKLQTFFNILDRNEIVNVLNALYSLERHTILNKLDRVVSDNIIAKLNDSDRISLFGEPDETKVASMFE